MSLVSDADTIKKEIKARIGIILNILSAADNKNDSQNLHQQYVLTKVHR